MSNARMMPRTDSKGRRYIGPESSSFGRKVYLVNPENRDFADQRFVLWFGAHCASYLMVWSDSLESAIEDAAEYLAEHMPGHIMTHDSDEYLDLLKEACEGLGLEYPIPEWAARVWDTPYERAVEEAESDLTPTESGFLTSYEWGIASENPTRADLESLCYPSGIDWSRYPEDGYRARRAALATGVAATAP